MDFRCVDCFNRAYEGLFDKWSMNESQLNEFRPIFDKVIHSSGDITSPVAQMILQREFSRIIGIEDLYADEKESSNAIAQVEVDKWKPLVKLSNDPFNFALRLAIAGNVMDYGASSEFDVAETIHTVLKKSFAIDHSSHLKKELSKAKNVLFLGDNAGEIVFDKLFIETIQHPNLTYVVRGGACLNDVTMKDAINVGMDKVAKIIDSGVAAPSTILEESSARFKQAFQNADLIISKGQGNLEGLLDLKDKRIFFLLMVKCVVIGELLNVDEGSFVVHNLKYTNTFFKNII